MKKYRQNELPSEKISEEHPFAGCDRLLGQYRILGQELLKLDARTVGYTTQPSEEDLSSFNRSLIFIPTQVLQSYRDDLINPEILPERLYIGEDSSNWYVPALSVAGIVGAVALGVYAASSGANFVLSFLLTLIVSSPFIAIWHLVPKDTSLRRLRYAQWLQDVIHDRNGSGDGMPSGTRAILNPFWFRGERQETASGAVSRIIIQ